MKTLLHLWRTRGRPALFSINWCKSWGKRLLLSPHLFKQFKAHWMLQKSGAQIGEGAFFSAYYQITGRKELLAIGEESFIGRVDIAVHTTVTIGSRVCINDGAKILSASHDVSDPMWSEVAKPIIIEDYVWVATNAIILPGVKIGRGAVIGAGAVVAADVPAYAIMIGNPARPLEKRRPEDLTYSPVSRLALYTAWRRLS